MTLPSGYAEFNDGDAVIRGRIAGSDGTFSGSFDAANIDAIESINVRDGAVSAYYNFMFPDGSMKAVFKIPVQKYTQIADIIIPIRMSALGYTNPIHAAKIDLYKNGVLLSHAEVYFDGWTSKGGGKAQNNDILHRLEYLQVVRFVDFDVTDVASYEIIFTNSSILKKIRPSSNNPASPVIMLSMLGPVTVGFRKR